VESGKFTTRAPPDLDAISTQHSMLFTHISGHVAGCEFSKALELAGITANGESSGREMTRRARAADDVKEGPAYGLVGRENSTRYGGARRKG